MSYDENRISDLIDVGLKQQLDMENEIEKKHQFIKQCIYNCAFALDKKEEDVSSTELVSHMAEVFIQNKAALSKSPISEEIEELSGAEKVKEVIYNSSVSDRHALKIISVVNKYFLEYKAAISKGNWISVEERLPENNVWVLISSDKGVFTECGIYCANCENGTGKLESGWLTSNSPHKETRITHWMPLPEKPIKNPFCKG